MTRVEDHQQGMRAALDEARQALKDGEFPVGCVITHRGRIVGRGHRLNSRSGSEIDHAEVVTARSALLDPACPEPAEMVVYSTMEPCLMCYATLLLSGFRTFVYGYEDVMGGGTGLDLGSLPPLYREMQVTVVGGVLRSDCLELFQRFFGSEHNDYWRDSLLARHTLAQAP